MELAQDIERIARENGAELFGVASASSYMEQFPDKPAPTRLLDGTKSIIVVGMPFEPGTVATVLKPELAGLKNKASEDVAVSKVQPAGAERFFLGEENGILVREIQLIGYKLAKYLRHQGYSALHLPPGKQNNRFRTAPFYHMPAMYMAGMGTLGLNCCILTPEFGPRVYVTSILTDCELEAGTPLENELCTKCKLCVENCPIGALDGDGWKNPFACASYGCCGTCMAICPIGA